MKKPTRSGLFRGLPKKGSRRRELLRMMLRPEGVTSFEAEEVGISPTQIKGNVSQFSNEKGWDIRSFKCKDPARIRPIDSLKHGRCCLVWKIVGRVRPNRYRALSNISLTGD